MVMTGVHDVYLVALSGFIAIIGSFTALSLAGRVRASRGRARWGWLAAAATALGGSIWSMHFVAMLAFSMPGVRMSYDVLPTLMSLALAIGFTGAGLTTFYWRSASARRMLASGLLIGTGVVSMHYLGMAAMRMPATLTYDGRWVLVSVLIAMVAATVGVWLAGRTQRTARRVAASIVMGIAITGMHYTGMYAATFTRAAGMDEAGGLASVGQTYLAVAISLVTLIVLGLGLAAMQFERILQRAADREARLRFLGEVNDHLFRSSDPRQAMAAAAELLGRRLGASRCAYADVDDDADRFWIRNDYTVPDLQSSVGEYSLALFGPRAASNLRAGQCLVVRDVERELASGEGREMFQAIAIEAIICCPLINGGRLAAMMAVHQDVARDWTPDELALVNEVVERCWAHVQRIGAEARLRELNEQLEQRVAAAIAERSVFASVVETTDAFIQVLDVDYRFVAINRASADELQRIYGIRPKVGDSIRELFNSRPEHHDDILAVWKRALAGEEFTVAEPFGDPSLDRRYYEMKFNVLRDAEGQRVGAYMFAHDITGRLRDQQKLADAEEHLRQAQKIEAIGQLTGGVAHDFNNLLMVISGGLNLFERAGPEKRERLMDGMRNAVERGASLTRQLLAFSRRKPLTPETVELPRQIDGMSELLDRTLRGDVHVETRFENGLWPVRIDPAELELVLLNLCVNARDAMPDGGTITITAENTNEAGAELTGEYVRLSVRDTGVGMPPEVQAKIFEPFFTTKDVGKGSGLGMAQVYGFAKQSEGGVRVRSVVGTGTTVELLLPRSQEVPISKERQLIDFGSGNQDTACTGSILLVEDDHEVAALVTEMLVDLGYQITRASSPEGALGALADGRDIDLVFSDIMMPGGMNGVELAREIRRRRPGLPILLTSGYAGAAAREAAVDDIPILAKPYELDTLYKALRRLRTPD